MAKRRAKFRGIAATPGFPSVLLGNGGNGNNGGTPLNNFGGGTGGGGSGSLTINVVSVTIIDFQTADWVFDKNVTVTASPQTQLLLGAFPPIGSAFLTPNTIRCTYDFTTQAINQTVWNFSVPPGAFASNGAQTTLTPTGNITGSPMTLVYFFAQQNVAGNKVAVFRFSRNVLVNGNAMDNRITVNGANPLSAAQGVEAQVFLLTFAADVLNGQPFVISGQPSYITNATIVAQSGLLSAP